MAEKKGVGHAYNVDFLNVVFAASSLFLFLSVVWMVWDDFDRDWKNTQRRFAELRVSGDAGAVPAGGRRRRQGQAGARSRPSSTRRKKNVAANQKKVDELQAKLADLNVRLDRATKDYQTTKATYDHDRYDFEASRAAKASRARPRRARWSPTRQKQLSDLDLQVQTPDRREGAAIQKQLGQYTGQVTTIAKQIDDMHGERDAGSRRSSTPSRRAPRRTTSSTRRCSTSWRRRSRSSRSSCRTSSTT